MDSLQDSDENEVIAIVSGEPIKQLPGDLYIPPDALRVMLDSFSGPLDLLLYLIRKQNLDILNIPITLITRQYMQYIEAAKQSRLELAADYLVMAAWLAEIKSRMLLPARSNSGVEEEEDPRAVLIKRLQQYEQFKLATDNLDCLPRRERDVFPICLKTSGITALKIHPDIELCWLTEALQKLLSQKKHFSRHQIAREPLSVRERMNTILAFLQEKPLAEFSAFYTYEEGRMGVVVSFLAILELSKQSLLIIIQADLFSPIHLKAN